jgi:hypothetical protein
MGGDVHVSKDVNSATLHIFLNEELARMNEELVKTGEAYLIEG